MALPAVGDDAEFVGGAGDGCWRETLAAVPGLEPTDHRADPAALLVEESNAELARLGLHDHRQLGPALAAVDGLDDQLLRARRIIALDGGITDLGTDERRLPDQLGGAARLIDRRPALAAVSGAQDQPFGARGIAAGRGEDQSGLLVEKLDVEDHPCLRGQIADRPALAAVG